MRSNTLKSNKLEINGSLKENKLACFTNSKGSFQVLDLVRDFEKVLPACTRNMFLHLGCERMYQKVSANKAYKKNCVPQFPILSALKLTSSVLAIFVDMNTYKGISKHSWKKIMQLIWTVVTYSLKKC